jgi:hypothetical protein
MRRRFSRIASTVARTMAIAPTWEAIRKGEV